MRRVQEILGVERAFGNPLDTVGLPRLRRDGNITAVLQALLEDDGIDLIAPRARHAGGRLGLPPGPGRPAGGGGARARASRCCSSPSCPTA